MTRWSHLHSKNQRSQCNIIIWQSRALSPQTKNFSAATLSKRCQTPSFPVESADCCWLSSPTWASTRDHLSVVRVVGDAVHVVVGLEPHAQLAGVCHHQWYGPSPLQLGHCWTVHSGDGIFPGLQASGQGHSCQEETSLSLNEGEESNTKSRLSVTQWKSTLCWYYANKHWWIDWLLITLLTRSDC